jgi:molecular chaperone DnaJ
MATKRDYYEVLGVERTATEDEIKKAFRQAALNHHPDRNPGDSAAEVRFKEAAEAYEVLSDPAKRGQYDRFGPSAFDSGGQYSGPTFTNVEDIFRHFGDIFGGGVFGEMFGRGSHAGPQAGRDLKIALELTLDEIDQGVQRTVSLKRLEPCATCHGSGAQAGTSAVTCSACGGRGQIHRNQGFFTMATTCPRCGGQGTVIEHPCPDCRGAGRLSRKSEIQITIPAGVEEGVRLRVPGQGDAGDPGAPRGDLYCVIQEVEHAFFKRNGADLLCEVPVTFSQLALGRKGLEIPTLRGRAALEIPAGTQNGKLFRLRGQGLAQIDGRARGDLLVRVFIEVPKSLSARQKEILEEFAKLEEQRSGSKSFFERIRNTFKSTGSG